MSRNSRSRSDRRAFLRGCGVSLAIPVFESILTETGLTTDKPSSETQAAEGSTAAARRFVCIAPDYGIHPGSFFPKQTGNDYVMPTVLSALQRHRPDLTVFSQLDHPGVGGGHGCTRTLLNGVKAGDAGGDRRKLLSLDQLIAEQIGSDTRFPSLITGRGAPISYTRAGIPIPSISKADQLFQLLFVEDDKQLQVRRKQSLRENRSILDVVLQDARGLRKRLAIQDQHKLEEYLAAVRETERKLARRRNWLDISKPRAKAPKPDEDASAYTDPDDMDLFYQIMVLALQTESTRVLVYQMPGGNRRFPFEGITLGYHTLTHHGQHPDRVRQLQIIDSYYLSQLAGFIDRLKKTKDRQGQPLLDSTLVFFGSGMGNASSHSSRNLPALVAGGGLKHGQHHTFPKSGDRGTPISNLYVTLLQQLGIETDRFASSNGDFNHLLT